MYDSRLIWREPVLTHAISALHWWLRWARWTVNSVKMSFYRKEEWRIVMMAMNTLLMPDLQWWWQWRSNMSMVVRRWTRDTRMWSTEWCRKLILKIGCCIWKWTISKFMTGQCYNNREINSFGCHCVWLNSFVVLSDEKLSYCLLLSINKWLVDEPKRTKFANCNYFIQKRLHKFHQNYAMEFHCGMKSSQISQFFLPILLPAFWPAVTIVGTRKFASLKDNFC